jgi:GAF domain-containing protein/HAMP domain-containing protein
VNSTNPSLEISGKQIPSVGGNFILRTQITCQLLSTLIGPLVGLYFLYVTAGLTTSQLGKLIVILLITLVVVNILHITYGLLVSRQSRDFLNHLNKNQPLAFDSDPVEAWKEIIAFPLRSSAALLVLLVFIIIVPIAFYMSWSVGVSLRQVMYLVIGGALSAFVALALNFLYLDTRLAPARLALLPADPEKQDIRIAFGQRARQYGITLILLLVTILTLGGISFQKITAMAEPGADLPLILSSFRLQLIFMSAIMLIVGLYVASRLVISIIKPTHELTRVMEKVRKGDYSERVPIMTSDDMARLTIHFNQMIDQLQNTQLTLEHQVQERTASLEERGKQLQAAAQVAREAAALPDVNSMISRTVNLISEQFGFYHAGIFLLDETGQYAVLQAASSEGGKNMLARGHKLAVGTEGIVGSAAYHNRPRIAMDVGADREFFNNPDLPSTRSEAALPLTVQGKVIGVLDIQSSEEARFITSDIEVLQILADQVALAIQNARLISDSHDALERLEAITAQNLRRTWQEKLTSTKSAYRYTSSGLVPAARLDGQKPLNLEGKEYLNIPIVLRGQRIGIISLHRKGETPWSDSDRSLVNEISTQVGLALENARLVQDTQLRAEREQTLSQVTARIRETLDLDVILQTAVREIKQSFNLDKAEVRLQLANETKIDSQPRQS